MVELVVVGAEGAFDAAVALRVVGPVEVMGELELGNGLCELAQELRSAVRLDRLDGEGEATDDLVQKSGRPRGWSTRVPGPPRACG